MSAYLTDKGLSAPRAADLLTIIRDAYETRLSAALGVDVTVDWDADVVLSMIATLQADQLGALSEAIQAVYDATDPTTAVGVHLDRIAVLTGIARRAATYGTVTVTCAGTSGTVIRAGAQVEGGGDNGTTRWVVDADATIPSGGSVGVACTCVTPGRVTADAGAITTIATPISGWASVTNAAAATPGRAREADSELRRRRQESLQVGGSLSSAALRANLLALGFIEAASVMDNPSTSTTTIAGISIPGCGVAVLVYPADTLTDAQQVLVAQTIYAHVPSGTQMAGSVTASVTKADGYAHTVRWSGATEIPLAVDVEVELDIDYVVDDVEQPIIDAVVDYGAALTVGQVARRLALYARIAEIPGVVAATVTIDGSDEDYVPTATQVVTIAAGDVAVTEV